jgi:hypothetical protein
LFTAKNLFGAAMAAKSLFGSGDYNYHGMDLMDKISSNGPPAMRASGANGRFIVRHREYLGDVSSGAGTPTAFEYNTFSLNPGLSDTFPWLSSIARNYEQYSIRGMVFEYKTLSVDAIAASTVNIGAVIMATDYNAAHVAFPNKQAMEQYEFCTSGKPSLSLLHPIECSSAETPVKVLYVRSASVPANTDPRLYDLGTFQIATQGLPAPANSIGELWVSYEIEFYKPNLPEAGPPSGNPDTGVPSAAAATWHFLTLTSAAWTSFSNACFGFGTFGLNAGSIPAKDQAYSSDQTSGYLMGSNTFSQANNGSASAINHTLFPKGTFGFVVPSGAAASMNKMVFVLDDEPHEYMLFVTQNGSSVAAGTLGVSVQGGVIVSTDITPFANNANALFSTPAAGVATAYVTMGAVIFVPALSNLGNFVGSASLTYAWASTPGISDTFVQRIY